MFRDTQEELQRLQQQLLEDDVPESEEDLLAEIADLIGDVQEGHTPDAVYNSDNIDLDPDELSDELLDEQPESLKGLVIAACLLTLGIIAVLGWWVVRLLG